MKGALKAVLKVVLMFAPPEARAIVEALVSIGALRHDSGEPVTKEELDALWDEARAEFVTLRSEAAASTARITGGQ